MAVSYKSAGVDIAAGIQAVNEIKTIVKQTFTPQVLSELGLFGGCYAFPVKDYREPVLVASTDGVGTKLMIANLMNRHNTVGQCLVNHCVNDILTTGAQPLFSWIISVLAACNRKPSRKLLAEWQAPAVKTAVH